MNTKLCLTVSDLALSRGERRLVDGLSFSVTGGEALAVTGPNGAGKTTLLRALAGFVRPDAGRIALAGAGPDDDHGTALHFIGHRDGLKGALSLRETLAFAPALMGGNGDPLAHAAGRLALTPLLDLPVAVLSAGQRRRAALARLLVVRRPVWLLDEPTAALDADSTSIVAGLIAEHLASGGIAIAATHLHLGIRARELALDAVGGYALGEAA